jgi:hypothetical protein
MLRLPYLIPALMLGLALSVGTARAQTQSAAATQTISGAGYQYQVPADWQTQDLTSTQKHGTQMITDDGAVASSDGSLRAHVETATGFGVTNDQLPNVLAALLGVGMGGNTSGAAPVVSLAGPDSAQVSNADTAISGAASYTDPSGASRVMAGRIALRGDTSYVLVLDVTQDFYKSDAGFAAIMNSLQLTSR